jgi:glyoxylase-like metal-dependent hydrolase (beta-lactamase superfamily II)
MQNHAHTHGGKSTRRDLFRTLLGATLAGATTLELAHHRGAWLRAMAPPEQAQLFDIEKAAEGIYFARARAQAEINCNSAIFVNASDVLVVDSHSKPSAAASLIAQIRKEVTSKPVRYVVNSHFHWDHTQGNHAYRTSQKQIDFIASEPTKKLLSELAAKRLKQSLEAVPQQIEVLRKRSEKAGSEAERAFCQGQIAQLQAYQTELQRYELELPTITFEKSHVLRDKAHELHIEHHGRAHTAGDIVVCCPAQKTIATGDMIHGFLPYIADGYPRLWPKTIDSVAGLPFDRLLPGHGPLHPDRRRMTSMRNYIEELTGKVEAGRRAGKAVQELQTSITVQSLKSMQSDGYAQFVTDNLYRYNPNFGPGRPLQESINQNIADVYRNLDRG